MMNRIAITGIGLVDNLGSSPEDCYANYISNEYVDPTEQSFKAKTDSLLFPEQMKMSTYARTTHINKLALHSVEQALKDIPKSQNVFTLYSTLTGGNEATVEFSEDVKDGSWRVKPKRLIQGLKDYAIGLIPMIYDFTGGSSSMNSACATSLYQLHYAFSLVEEYDYIVCGAADSGVNDFDMTFFNKLGALGSHSSPFDKDRDGFIMGEGAGCLILEDPEKAKNRGATIYGYIHKPALASDGSAGNVVAPSDVGIRIAMKKAISNIDKNDIAFVSAHATSTPAGDETEYNTICEVLPDTPVTAFKSKLGHTLGASSINEIIYTLMALRNKTIPKSHNLKKCDLNNVAVKNSKTSKNLAVKNSLAFGAKCASVVIEAI